jgi:hypothetical protein
MFLGGCRISTVQAGFFRYRTAVPPNTCRAETEWLYASFVWAIRAVRAICCQGCRTRQGIHVRRLFGQGRPPRRISNAEEGDRSREIQETLFAGTIALEISSRSARIQALQKRWDHLRAGLDLILDQRGADMADVPGGASGLLMRAYKGKRLVTRIVTRRPNSRRRLWPWPW